MNLTDANSFQKLKSQIHEDIFYILTTTSLFHEIWIIALSL